MGEVGVPMGGVPVGTVTGAWQACAVPTLSADLEFRGLVYQATDPGLLARLDRPEPLTAYIGFDPTADSLHVGHLVQVLMLRRLQLAGHRPVALAGGATGMIGDPGGKQSERPLLDREEVGANVAAIGTQLAKLIDFAGGAVLLDNADWLGSLDVIGFLRDVGKHFTVNQMVAKESVRARLDRPDRGISYAEFSYMLLQAYDFVHLYDAVGCRVQLGASDQWGNITMGIELVRKLRGAEVWGLTTPLVLKADGTKFGKTETGAVWLDPARTSPYAFYQFFLRTDDVMVGSYLRRFTFLDHQEIAALDDETAEHPERRAAQRALARSVCSLVHGQAETEQAERAAAALFSEDIAGLDEPTLLAVCAEAPTDRWGRREIDGGIRVVDAMARTGLVSSKSQARTTVAQGGAYVNNRRVTDVDMMIGSEDLLHGRYLVLRRGRREQHLVVFD